MMDALIYVMTLWFEWMVSCFMFMNALLLEVWSLCLVQIFPSTCGYQFIGEVFLKFMQTVYPLLFPTSIIFLCVYIYMVLNF